MRNLQVYIEDSFTFYEKVLKAKNNTSSDPNYKARLNTQKKTLAQLYKDYDEAFVNDTLGSLCEHGFSNGDKEDLLKLYSYRSAIMKKLKITVTTIDGNRVLNTCQNCTIGEVNSFDHLVPKNDYSEFIVHPKNLFPSCTKCNSHKNKVWKIDSNFQFLNLYLDKLPREQFLFVNLLIDHRDTIQAHFYIENVNGIDDNLFERIENHYDKLHLHHRFEASSNVVITSLEFTFQSSKAYQSKKKTLNIAKDVCQREKEYYGMNYWQSILKEAILCDKKALKIISK